MNMRTRRLSLSLLLVLQMFSMPAMAAPLKLYVSYPAGWQLREPLLQDNVLNYEARQQVNGKTVQRLTTIASSAAVYGID